MRIGVYSDLHLRGADLASGQAALRAAFRGMREAGVSIVLDAGDTFDRAQIGDRDAFPGTLLNAYMAAKEDEIPDARLLVVEGNHTQPRPGQQGPLAALARLPNTSVFSKPLVSSYGAHVVTIGYLPWASKLHYMTRPEVRSLPAEEQDRGFREACRGILAQIRDRFAAVKDTSFKIVLGHAEVAGAVNAYNFILPGSTFCFSGTDLANTGADLVLLGHYHRRQAIPGCPNGWYVGALRQLNHGEEGNPCGWLLVDTATGEHTWRDLPEAPRYYTVASLPEKMRPQDRYKLRGDEAPEGKLPANVVFEAVTVPREAAQREILDPSASLPQLLRAWAESAGNNLEYELGALDELIAGLEETVPAGWRRGSLERILSVRIAGIGPHRDTMVDLSSGDWWAVCGSNGAGKTLLLEATLACWYGSWAHPYRGSLYEAMTAEEARLEVVWESGGRTYHAARRLTKRGKTQKQEATLTCDGKPVAGPKVSDFEVAVEPIVGSRSYLLGSIFLSQKAEGDLVAATAGERQDFMRRYLGLERFDALAGQAKCQADELAGQVRGMESDAAAPDLDALAASVASAETAVAEHGEAIRILESAAQVAAEQHSKLLQQQAVRAGLEQAEARERMIQAGARQQVERLESRLTALDKSLAIALPELRYTIELLSQVADQEARLQAQDEAHRAARTTQTELRQAILVLEAEGHATRASHKARVDAVRAETARIRREITRSQDAQKRLAGVGCASQGFLPCPLIDGARSDQAQLDTLREQLADLDLQLFELEMEEPSDSKELLEARSTLANHLIPPPAPTSEWDRVREQQARLARAQQELARLEAEEGQKANIEGDLAQARAALQEATERYRAATEAVLQAQDIAPQIRDQEALIAKVRGQLADVRRDAAQAQQELGSAERALADGKRLTEELAERHKRRAVLRERRDLYRVLQTAFGRDGIPQLLVSAALPALQSILDEVCAVDFDGRFALRLDTVRQTKTAGSRESFDVLFSRRGREYDARQCSGGEEAAVRAALRCALVLYQAAQAAATYRVAFLDEPAAHQDGEMAQASIAMLDRLRERFSQVVVVSHDEEMLAGFPYRVCLEPGPHGTRIVDQEVEV